MGTLLCIDDQTYAQAQRVEWLRAHGYVVVVAGSIESALDAFLTSPIDAALLDCHVRGASLVATLLKRMRPGLPIIMLASFCGVPCGLGGVVSACLGKGEAPSVLLNTLQAVLKRGDSGQEAA